MQPAPALLPGRSGALALTPEAVHIEVARLPERVGEVKLPQDSAVFQPSG